MKINLKLDNYQGDINLRRKRGKMINEENKYLAQSDESDSEYREQQKKEDELQRKLRENRQAQENLEKKLHELEQENDEFETKMFNELKSLNRISESNSLRENGVYGNFNVTLSELRENVQKMRLHQKEFYEEMRRVISKEYNQCVKDETGLKRELSEFS